MGKCEDQDEADGGGLGPFDCSTLKSCKEAADAQQFGAFSGCVTLIFALMGCITRIRWRQDSNFQKLIGMLPDTFSMFTTYYGLRSFATDCLEKLPDESPGGLDLVAVVGPGYMAYWICWACAGVRALMHWLIPCPGQGAGVCVCTHPEAIANEVQGIKQGVQRLAKEASREASGFFDSKSKKISPMEEATQPDAAVQSSQPVADV